MVTGAIHNSSPADMLFAVSYRAGLKSAPAYLVVRQTQRLLHRTTKSTIKRPLTKMNEVEEAIWEIEGASPGPTVVVLGGKGFSLATLLRMTDVTETCTGLTFRYL